MPIQNRQKLCGYLFAAISILFSPICPAEADVISLFPLDHYSQHITDWINTSDVNYDKPVLSTNMQQQHFKTFYKHYFGTLSPWNAEYIHRILHFAPPDDVKNLEQTIITAFSNNHKTANEIGYGENFRPHTKEWMDKIVSNINLDQWHAFTYQPNHRGIAIDNLQARVLPTEEVHFYHYTIAGEGFPFDNFQISALWAGTPVYIITETLNHAWLLVITPDYIGWVKAEGIARVDNAFITRWTTAAKKQLAAITNVDVSMVDQQQKFHFLSYAGSVFPGEQKANNIKMLIPVSNANQQAVIKTVTVSSANAAIMPLSATPHHITSVMNALLGRPYGWGNMYFYNDCSAETKNVLTPFGIWLPRHSSDQVYAGKLVDMSAASPEARISYLQENGRRFMTIVYIGGHVMMYIGNYPNPNTLFHRSMVMTYQDVWGLSPHPATRRAVIGQSVLFPLLLRYPEDTSLVSPAEKHFFQVSFLDEVPNYSDKIEIIDLKSLMAPS